MRNTARGVSAIVAALSCAALLLNPFSTTPATATDVVTDPVGFYQIPCYSNADTAVSLPFTRMPEFRGLVASAAGNVISVSNNPGWVANQWVYNPAGGVSNLYYVVVTTNSKAGAYYTIGTNDASTLTVTGLEDLTGISPGDALQIIPYWTLNTVFPGGQGVVPTPSIAQTKTTVQFFSPTGTGINLPPGGGGKYIYFTPSNYWAKTTAVTINANDTPIAPGEPFIVRNQFTGTGMTTTTNIAPGAVSLYPSRTPLFMQVSVQQDNPVGLYRPAAQSLNESGLSNVFHTSTLTKQTDILEVYAAPTGINNPPGGGGKYVLATNGWRKTTSFTTDVGTNQIFQPGAAYIIRRDTNAAPSTIWINVPNYSNQ